MQAFVLWYEVHVLGSDRMVSYQWYDTKCNLLGELAFGFVVVDSITGNSRELPASVVLIMDVICYVLEVLHVGSDTKQGKDVHFITLAPQRHALNMSVFTLDL